MGTLPRASQYVLETVLWQGYTRGSDPRVTTMDPHQARTYKSYSPTLGYTILHDTHTSSLYSVLLALSCHSHSSLQRPNGIPFMQYTPYVCTPVYTYSHRYKPRSTGPSWGPRTPDTHRSSCIRFLVFQSSDVVPYYRFRYCSIHTSQLMFTFPW